MQLGNIPLDERTTKALMLCAERSDLMARIKSFVGEANCDHNGDGSLELKQIASNGIIEATKQHIAQEGK